MGGDWYEWQKKKFFFLIFIRRQQEQYHQNHWRQYISDLQN